MFLFKLEWQKSKTAKMANNVAVSDWNNLTFCFSFGSVKGYYSEPDWHIEKATHAKSVNSIHKANYYKSTFCF
jgi:hypothetical protein